MKRAFLEEFRQAAYNYLGRADDAAFELIDAILLTRNAYSLADLSLSPVFRRKWPSIYEALEDSRRAESLQVGKPDNHDNVEFPIRVSKKLQQSPAKKHYNLLNLKDFQD